MDKFISIVKKLYLVIHATNFEYTHYNPTKSAIGNIELNSKRLKILEASLNPQRKPTR